MPCLVISVEHMCLTCHIAIRAHAVVACLYLQRSGVSLLKAAGRTASVTFNVVNITDGMAWHGMYAAFSGYYKVHLEACKSNFMYFT